MRRLLYYFTFRRPVETGCSRKFLQFCFTSKSFCVGSDISCIWFPTTTILLAWIHGDPKVPPTDPCSIRQWGIQTQKVESCIKWRFWGIRQHKLHPQDAALLLFWKSKWKEAVPCLILRIFKLLFTKNIRGRSGLFGQIPSTNRPAIYFSDPTSCPYFQL